LFDSAQHFTSIPITNYYTVSWIISNVLEIDKEIF